MSKHLWEIKHSYYCNHGNYFTNEPCTKHYKSLASYLEEYEEVDKDYNLLFRWDWKEGEDEGLPIFNGDINYRNGLLCLYFMGQRKGLYQYMTVEVCRADEDKVIEYLKPNFDHMKSLWEGIS